MPHTSKRTGTTNSLYLMLFGSLVAVAGLSILLFGFGSDDDGPTEIEVFCAAGIRKPMEDIAKQYEKEFGVTVNFQFGGSGDLLGKLGEHRSGDLYLAGDDSFIKEAVAKDLAAEVLPLAYMKPVIAVPKGNPKDIKSLADILQPGIRVSIGNPGGPNKRGPAIGRKTRKLLETSGDWEAMHQHVEDNGVFKPTVNEIANDVKVGSVDAGIVWDSMAALMDLDIVAVPELDKGEASVEIAVLNSSKHPTAALKFARYVAARDKGMQVFQRKHFKTISDGDVWAEKPELTIQAGSVNQRALRPIIEQFMQREGVQINEEFAGCGILTGKMAEDNLPDVFVACDVYYLRKVQQFFEPGTDVSDTDIIIAVQQGNPKNIQSLEDLANDGVRVAVGEGRQCTIGVLTRQLLDDEGLYEKIEPNIVTRVDSSANLIPQVVNKAADAVLAYRTDSLAEQSRLEVIDIDSPFAKAVQPFTISLSSKHKYLCRRFLDHIARSRSKYIQAGFNWRMDGQTPAPEKLDSDAKQPAPIKNSESS